jgi:hypothetical protein
VLLLVTGGRPGCLGADLTIEGQVAFLVKAVDKGLRREDRHSSLAGLLLDVRTVREQYVEQRMYAFICRVLVKLY